MHKKKEWKVFFRTCDGNRSLANSEITKKKKKLLRLSILRNNHWWTMSALSTQLDFQRTVYTPSL